MLPELTVRIVADDSFRRAARHALMTMGLIAGFKPCFINEGIAQITYAPAPPDEGFWLPADPEIQKKLLRKNPLKPEIGILRQHGIEIHVLFSLAVDSPIAFDLPSAAFFFLSLHEQWTSEERDAFGRFPASASLLGRNGLLDTPVASRYGRLLRQVLLAGGYPVSSDPRFNGKSTAICLTHDIDYLSKYTPGLLFREIVKNFLFDRRGVSFIERMARLREYLSFGLRGRDPYIVSIDRMLDGERSAGASASWLFKAGGNDRRDVSYNVRGKKARAMITRILSEGHDVGLHPSFNAHVDASMFAREARTVADVSQKKLRSVRQHYLRFVYPDTWRLQVANGCEVDSTLGFAEHEGFRNGFCHPFLPFDLETNDVIPLWELPLTVMDGTLSGYRGLRPDAALDRIRQLMSIVAAEQGSAVLLFHNTAFDEHDFPGWGRVFTAVCDDISHQGDLLAADLPETARSWAHAAGFQNPGEFRQVINSEPL